jgi:hypothetical protein
MDGALPGGRAVGFPASEANVRSLVPGDGLLRDRLTGISRLLPDDADDLHGEHVEQVARRSGLDRCGEATTTSHTVRASPDPSVPARLEFTDSELPPPPRQRAGSPPRSTSVPAESRGTGRGWDVKAAFSVDGPLLSNGSNHVPDRFDHRVGAIRMDVMARPLHHPVARVRRKRDHLCASISYRLTERLIDTCG